MTTLTRAETARWLSERDQFLILTHVRPDGDTLGSAALLCRGLRKLGKTAHILENPGITAKYAALHEGLTQKEALAGDTLVSVDVAAPNMLPDAFRPLQERIALRIDHHGTATPFTPLSLVDAGAAACAQAGADLSDINLALFETNSFARLKIQSYLVEHARFYRDGTLAVCPLPRAIEESVGAGEDDLENISGFPRSIAGVKMAATLREDPDGRVKISVRAVPGYDASAVCARFGGGGHKGAAGASLHLPLEEAAQAVAAAMEELV